MLTPQEVSGRAFSKAAFGGYNMAMVDEFLDELTDDYTSLYKENAALKAKLIQYHFEDQEKLFGLCGYASR